MKWWKWHSRARLASAVGPPSPKSVCQWSISRPTATSHPGPHRSDRAPRWRCGRARDARPTWHTERTSTPSTDEDLDERLGKQARAVDTGTGPTPGISHTSPSSTCPRRSAAASTRRCTTVEPARGRAALAVAVAGRPGHEVHQRVGGVGGGRLVFAALRASSKSSLARTSSEDEHPRPVVGGELELAPERPVGITPVPKEPALADGFVPGILGLERNRPRRAPGGTGP